MDKTMSIMEVSETLQIPKDTLRYYDRLSLVSPQRGENQYRYYTQGDMHDLQYIEVMKYAEFSLKEIEKILLNKQGCTEENLKDTMQLLENKQHELKKKIELYHHIMGLITDAMDMLYEKKPSTESEKLNQMISNIFNEMRGK